MTVAGLFFAALLLVVIALLVVRRKPVAPQSGSVGELLQEVICKLVGMHGYMDKAWGVFSPDAYQGLEKQFPWKRGIRKRLRVRGLRAATYIARIEFHVEKFEALGLGVLALGRDETAIEVVRRATACKILLRPVKWRVRLYNRLPLFMWMVLGHNHAKTCIYGGRALLFEYSELAGAVLALVRARGDDYHYDCLVDVM
jgi:hypothetical protein